MKKRKKIIVVITIIIAVLIMLASIIINKSKTDMFKNDFLDLHSQILIEFEKGNGENKSIDQAIPIIKNSESIDELLIFLEDNKELQDDENIRGYFTKTYTMIDEIRKIKLISELSMEERFYYTEIINDFVFLEYSNPRID